MVNSSSNGDYNTVFNRIGEIQGTLQSFMTQYKETNDARQKSSLLHRLGLYATSIIQECRTEGERDSMIHFIVDEVKRDATSVSADVVTALLLAITRKTVDLEKQVDEMITLMQQDARNLHQNSVLRRTKDPSSNGQ